MENCIVCAAENSLHDNGVPVCNRCADERASKPDKPNSTIPTPDQTYRNNLLQAMLEATALANAASTAFSGIADDLSCRPQPNGVQRLHDASGELSRAREQMIKAHNRLNDFLARGIVPDDLKQDT
jgi:hypothetical protein